METRDVARRTATAAKLLISASLFFVLIWWWVSAELFLAGCVLLGVAFVLGGGAVHAPAMIQE